MIIHDWNRGKWVFKDINSLGCPFHHIHPYKQNAVWHMAARKPDWVRHMIVFGSAVKRGHFFESDLDLCVVCSASRHELDFGRIKLPNIRYDIIAVDSLEALREKADFTFGSVYYYVVRDGVMVA